MPPQPGLFSVPYGTTPTYTQYGIATASSGGPGIEGGGSSQQYQSHGRPSVAPSARNGGSTMEDGRKESKKRKDAPRLGKDMSDRRDDARHFAESVTALHTTAQILSIRPDMSDHFLLRLFPLSIERSSVIAQLDFEERYAVECAQVAYDEERERVEEEWRRGRDRVRERLLEGIEERRRRAREEKDGEIIGDVALDSHSRPPITRKLRNKLGTSPPPTPHITTSHLMSNLTNGTGTPNGTLASNLPITTGPFLNPHSLSVEDLPSPFPLPLTTSHLPYPVGGASSATAGGGVAGGQGAPNGPGRKRVKGGANQGQAVGGLGKSLLVLNVIRDNDVENDLNEIRRGNKRRRAAAAATAARG